MIMSSRFAVLFALTVPLAAGACHPKAVRGGEGTDNPNLDEGALSTGLDREDLSYLAKKNLGALMASPVWAQWRGQPKQPIVAIWPACASQIATSMLNATISAAGRVSTPTISSTGATTSPTYTP